MISITMMLIISTLQSSIDKMVPKTSYLKMVDIFLIYSFNIVIVIMGVHTYMVNILTSLSWSQPFLSDCRICAFTEMKSLASLSMRQDHQVSNFYCQSVMMSVSAGVTKVEPMVRSGEESRVSSRVSSARSLVSSMWSGSEEEEVDAFARARRVNFYGQIGFLAIFFIFMLVFWSVALDNYFNEIKFFDESGMKIEDDVLVM